MNDHFDSPFWHSPAPLTTFQALGFKKTPLSFMGNNNFPTYIENVSLPVFLRKAVRFLTSNTQLFCQQSHCCIHRLRILIGLKRKRQVIQAAVTELYPQTLELTNNLCWLVVSTPLKNISQNVNLPQIEVKIKHIWNHHPVWNGHVNSPSQNGVTNSQNCQVIEVDDALKSYPLVPA